MNFRQTIREIAKETDYRDPDGRLLLRVSEDWTSPVYDRRGAPIKVSRGDLFAFDLDEMQVRYGRGYNYLPHGTREYAVALSKSDVAVWDMFAHVLTHYELVTGADSFTTAGIDETYAAEILAMLLARGQVSVPQIRAVYDAVLSAEALPEYTWAWR